MISPASTWYFALPPRWIQPSRVLPLKSGTAPVCEGSSASSMELAMTESATSITDDLAERQRTVFSFLGSGMAGPSDHGVRSRTRSDLIHASALRGQPETGSFEGRSP